MKNEVVGNFMANESCQIKLKIAKFRLNFLCKILMFYSAEINERNDSHLHWRSVKFLVGRLNEGRAYS